ncbi:galactose-3-O-sulfotransferase 2-like [Liolophura sinensis]|uniref:galactose-3-O-sulfotransferase 2-like n=1 Tax=Liolophura sinensis TaxID=3198878 RepID=UPI0031581FA5
MACSRLNAATVSQWKRNIKTSVYVVVVFILGHYLWRMLIGYPVSVNTASLTDTDPHRRVFLLTIPFTEARETIGSVIWRYTITHGLSTILTKGGESTDRLGTSPKAQNSFLRPYHTAVTELIYNPTILRQFLRVNTPYITVLRHPLVHLQSAIQNPNTKDGKSTTISVKDFLENPGRFEKQWAQQISLTNNPYARYFGMPPDCFHNDSLIKELISTIDRDFSAVLILEKMDESLVMFRRVMRWSYKDISYNLKQKPEIFPDMMQMEDIVAKHRAWAEADYAIYEHFNNKLNEYVQRGGETFAVEVSKFRQALTTVNDFCGHALRQKGVHEVEFSDWSGNVTFSLTDCKLLQANEGTLRNILAKRQVRI